MDQLKELTLLVRGKLSDLERAVLVALITQDVHARDIVNDMKTHNVCSIFEFAWQQQLRFYYSEEDSGSVDNNPVTVK